MRSHSYWGSTAAFLLILTASLPCRAADLGASNDVVAVEFLGTVDCYWYPESQQVLIDVLTTHPCEKVRYAAAMAITQQLQRGKVPLDATSGWRQVPDPEILTQICRLSCLQRPLTREELYKRYADRQTVALRQKELKEGAVCHDCCNADVIGALARTATEKDQFDCFLEPSERVRWRAQRALRLCRGTAAAETMLQQPGAPPIPIIGGNQAPFTPGSSETMGNPYAGREQFQPGESGLGPNVPVLGRADTTNRFNIFDNMSAMPRSRVWYGFQFVEGQNNAVFQTGSSNKLFSLLNSEAGRADFIAFTGFGRQPGQPAINPHDPASAEALRRQFLVANGGRSQTFLQNPNTDLHRFGLEYAFTTDFSVSLIGQYVVPLNETEQPAAFSNPSIQLKHVLYRSEDTLFSGVFSIQPQISRPKFAVGEDTSRLSPGFLTYHRLTDNLFSQNAVGLSFPTESNQITTADFAFSVGYWLYKHESLEPWYVGPTPTNWVLGIVPQFEVLGKNILGSNTVNGQFNLSSSLPKTANGTTSPVDNSRNIYFPQDLPAVNRFGQTSFIFTEPRHVVDLSFGITALLRDKFVVSSGLSVPVTKGNARKLEFLTTINKYF